MIHVQIASQITAQGVSGVRWVLVETVDAAQAQQAAPAVALAAPDTAAAPAGAAPTPEGLRLVALKAVVVALGLGAALWTAVVQIGPPGQAAVPRSPASPAGSASVPAAASPQQPQRQAVPLRIAPAARPGAPATSAPVAAPAASAAADGLPRLTAGL